MNLPAPFTENQYAFFSRCFDHWFNVAEGGKRGGKNVLITMAYCAILEQHPSRIHLIAGVSTATARINILDCDGYGMLNFFEGRCREGQYQNRDCLYVNTPTGEKIVLISGGGKNGDEKLIKGNTYGTAYITEANECARVFIQEVFDRTLSSSDRKVFHDLNPKAAGHWYYQDIIGFHEDKQQMDPGYGYNYGHFTIADNMSLSDDQLRGVLRTYNKDSVWYARDILGLRKVAEGLIYSQFAGNKGHFAIRKDQLDRQMLVNVGVDFGGNKSAHAFVASGLSRDYNITALRSAKIPAKGVSVEQLVKKFVDFCHRLEQDFRCEIDYIYADNAEQAIINSMVQQTKYNVRNSVKGEIIDRIRTTDLHISEDRFRYVEGECDSLVEAMCEAVWDPDELDDVRLDDGTSDIDTLDAFEYSWSAYIRQILRG